MLSAVEGVPYKNNLMSMRMLKKETMTKIQRECLGGMLLSFLCREKKKKMKEEFRTR